MKALFHAIESLWCKPFDGLLSKYRGGMTAIGLLINLVILFRMFIGEFIHKGIKALFTNADFTLSLPPMKPIDEITSPSFFIPALIILVIMYIAGNRAGWAAWENLNRLAASSRKNAFIERLLSASPVGALMTDAKGVLTYTNSEAHKIFSQDGEMTVVGRNIRDLDLVANTVLVETVDKVENAFAGVFRKEVAFKRSPSSLIQWYDCFLSPVSLDADRLGCIGWIHDKTEQHRKQEDVINSIILALTKAIDAKDRGTHEHSLRIRKIAMTLAGYLSLPPEKYPTLEYASLLHDVGKILLPDDIIQGKVKLGPEQKEIIARLPEYSASFLDGIDDLAEVRQIVFHQREWYVPPKDENAPFKPFPGIKTGDGIPIESRIIAVADAFEGMITEKPYRKAMPKEIAVIEFKRSSGIKPTEDEINRLLLHYKQTQNKSMGLDELLSHSRIERQFDYKVVRALETAILNNQI